LRSFHMLAVFVPSLATHDCSIYTNVLHARVGLPLSSSLKPSFTFYGCLTNLHI